MMWNVRTVVLALLVILYAFFTQIFLCIREQAIEQMVRMNSVYRFSFYRMEMLASCRELEGDGAADASLPEPAEIYVDRPMSLVRRI